MCDDSGAACNVKVVVDREEKDVKESKEILTRWDERGKEVEDGLREEEAREGTQDQAKDPVQDLVLSGVVLQRRKNVSKMQVKARKS